MPTWPGPGGFKAYVRLFNVAVKRVVRAPF